MKKILIILLLALFAFNVSAQQIPTVAVATFDVIGGITTDESKVVTELFMAELVSKGTVKVVDRENFDKIIAEMRFQTTDWSDSQKTAQLGRVLNAEYIIRGQLMKMGSITYWTATMIDVNTAQVVASAREQVSDLGQIWGKLSGFCLQILNKMPLPNYFLGKWQSISGSGHYCILVFMTDGSIIVERYDTYGGNSPAQRGRGTGNYSFDSALFKIALSLTDCGTSVISGNSIYYFDGSKNSFTLSNNILLNYFGQSYSNREDYYKLFIKVQ